MTHYISHFTLCQYIILFLRYIQYFFRLTFRLYMTFFLRPIRKNAKHFYGRKKMWRNKNAQRAEARLRFCVARAAEGGEAYTDLLGAGFLLLLLFKFMFQNIFIVCIITIIYFIFFF